MLLAGSIEDETSDIEKDEMLMHSATMRFEVRSGMREHFDEHAVDLGLAKPPETPRRT